MFPFDRVRAGVTFNLLFGPSVPCNSMWDVKNV